MAGFECACSRYFPTVSHLTSSSRAIRRRAQPCAAKVKIECYKLTLSSINASFVTGANITLVLPYEPL